MTVPESTKLTIPELSLVVLVGPSGCGKSTFARKHFKPTEVISSDFCRGLVSDDENNQVTLNLHIDVVDDRRRHAAALGVSTGNLDDAVPDLVPGNQQKEDEEKDDDEVSRNRKHGGHTALQQ